MMKKIDFKELLSLIEDGNIVYVSKKMFGKLPSGDFGLLKDELRNFYTQVDMNYIEENKSGELLLEYDDNQERLLAISEFLNIDLHRASLEVKKRLFDLKLFNDKEAVFLDNKEVYISCSSFSDNGFNYTVSDTKGEVIRYSVPEYDLKASA